MKKNVIRFVLAAFIMVCAFGCASTAPQLKAAQFERSDAAMLMSDGDNAKLPCEKAKYYGQAIFRDPSLENSKEFSEKVTEAVNKCMPAARAKSN